MDMRLQKNIYMCFPRYFKASDTVINIFELVLLIRIESFFFYYGNDDFIYMYTYLYILLFVRV